MARIKPNRALHVSAHLNGTSLPTFRAQEGNRSACLGSRGRVEWIMAEYSRVERVGHGRIE
eukprot:4663781-Pyramimonas_sp.AAC.1